MWFMLDEFEQRLARCQQMMKERGLDYLLVFEPESVTYYTGFYTDGYNTSFQAAIIPAEGAPFTILRAAERFYFDTTAAWPDRAVVWLDGETPAQAVIRATRELGVSGVAGVEGGSWRAPYSLVAEVIAERADVRFVDIQRGLNPLRFVKSAAEIDYHRIAARAADAMQAATSAAIRPGVTEHELALVAVQAALRNGSDVIDPGPIASGERARHIHAYFSDGVVSDKDVVFLEMDASNHRYRSRSMRTIIVGEPEAGAVDAYRRFEEAQREALATVKAGVSCRVPDQIVREAVLASGWVDSYPNKTFYGMGLMLSPTTYEPLEVTPDADFEFEAGMLLHAYVSARGLNVSETIVVTETGCELLTQFDRALIRK